MAQGQKAAFNLFDLLRLLGIMSQALAGFEADGVAQHNRNCFELRLLNLTFR
jgi:hypothetical protein